MNRFVSIDKLFEALAETLSPAEIIAAGLKANVATEITTWRIEKNMTQQDFAEYMGVSQSTISKWENGDYNFTIEKIAELAAKLDVTPQVSLGSPARMAQGYCSNTPLGRESKVVSISAVGGSVSRSVNARSANWNSEGFEVLEG